MSKTAIRIAAIKRMADSIPESCIRTAGFDAEGMDEKVKKMSDKDYSDFMVKIAGVDNPIQNRRGL
jgi:hypothetical protein